MRNYIILNGNNSNTISGLLIQSLPPISKPLMRTAIEEIDGRDGDIVTNLGYSAYDKEVSIGLYGTYDVDEVIKYFNDNSKGQVTFSNEPDKYYNYEIINQIDFERLIRFKTAIVTLHCQPFKYPTEETPVEINIQNITNEAEEMDLDNTADAPMTLALKGNTSQASEPTPDSPVDVNVVSGDNTIEICGKNLFDKNSVDIIQAHMSVSGHTIKLQNQNYTAIFPCKPSTTYTLQKKVSTRFVVMQSPTLLNVTSTTQTIQNVQSFGENTSGTLTTENDTNYIYFEFYGGDDLTEYQKVLDSIQIEKGSTATEYEAYTGNSQLISLGNIELNKIDTYQDYIYKDNDRWFLHKETGKIVLNGSENWTKTNNAFQILTVYPADVALRTDTDFAKSNYYEYGYVASSITNLLPNNKFSWSGGKALTIRNDSCVDSTAFKTWLSSHNTEIYYPLATPTNTEITDTTLISQLNNLKNNVKSYDPITHITQNANDKPFMLNATAVQKGTDTATVDNDGNIYSKPTLDIEGNGTVAIYLNGNQMFSVDLSNSSECVIDVTNLEAYDPETNELMNRQVTGDYSKFILPVGENQVKVSGNVTKTTISDYVRWL